MESGADVLVMPTLGRPFELGMLYDQRSDKLIPGVTLWDPEDLKQDLSNKSLPKTQFDIVTEDRMEDKASTLDINANLKLSFLGGLVNVEGSAKYLDDRKKSSQVARVTLKYECTTTFEQLSMKHLGRNNIKYTYVFEDKSATHVVVGIAYGAKAFFVFDKEVSDHEEHKHVHGDLKVMIKSIPNFSVDGQASVDLTEDEKVKIDKMHCMFYGDFLLKRNPTTFQEAVKTYNELPKLLGEDYEKAVSVQVWLYPLSKLDIKAAQLIREIGTGLVKQTEDVFEDFQNAQEICTDLTRSGIYSHYPDIKKSISAFRNHLETYILDFKKRLLDILPYIRGGGKTEEELAQLLRENKAGPFSSQSLNKWLNGKQKEIKILQAYIQVMKDTSFATAPGALDKYITTEDQIVCFHFHLNSCDDQQLVKMTEFLNPTSKTNRKMEDNFDALLGDEDDNSAEKEAWFEIGSTKRAMREAAHTFRDFKKVNKDLTFIVTTEDDESRESGASIEIYKEGTLVEKNFRPPSQPSAPCAVNVTFDSVTLAWVKSDYGAEFIEHYYIFYKTVEDERWDGIDTMSSAEKYTVTKLKSSTLYAFKVQGKCKVGCSRESDVSEPIETEFKEESLAEKMIKDNNTMLLSSDPPNTYRLPLHLRLKDKDKGIRHYTLGQWNRSPEKVLMVVGATGAGKSTLLNGIVNYLLNVKWSDPFRFKVVAPDDEESEMANNQAYSQTEYISAYTFYHHPDMPYKYNLTIIDTPGYGDCRGIKRDKKITSQIKDFFTNETFVDHLDAVCFVTQSPGRLTPTQKYIIDSILSIYANNIIDNIVFLITFADGQSPPVLDSIKAAKIPYHSYYKFNNSALFANNQETQDSVVDRMFWDMGMLSLENFFKEIDKLEPKSLQLTKEVLKERQNMEATVQGIQPQIKEAIAHMNNLDKEKDLLDKYESQINENKNFTYTVMEDQLVKKNLPTGRYVTNCQKCNMTCHDNCAFANDADKQRCSAMSGSHCTVCPQSCHWTEHHNMKFYWETEQRPVSKEYNETKQRYHVAQKGKAGKEEVVKNMASSYDRIKKGLLSLVQKVKSCIVRLGEIALRPSPLSTTAYVDILIESEQREAKRGWEERTKHLQEVRKEAELIEKIQKGESLHGLK